MHGFWRLAWHDFSDIICKKNSTLVLLAAHRQVNHDLLSLFNWKLSNAMEIGLGLDYFIAMAFCKCHGRKNGWPSIFKLGSAHYIEGFTPADDVYLILPAIAGIEKPST